ncbi:MAG: hypothetical protein KDC62_07545 [Aequorivita sp.]|nr:hypothetical protein [Aequorivita sp.]
MIPADKATSTSAIMLQSGKSKQTALGKWLWTAATVHQVPIFKTEWRSNYNYVNIDKLLTSHVSRFTKYLSLQNQ